MLLTKEDFESGRCRRWAMQAHDSFVSTLRDTDYPCYFGAQAERQGHLRYGLVTHGRYEHLIEDLAEFVALSGSNPRARHLFVVFFDEHGDLREDEDRFWELLQWLHEHDPAPWPREIPADPNHPSWEFCFGGDPMFVFPSIPGYRKRHSRRIGDAFALCFQPRRIFAGVERDDPGGEAIRSDIYRRVRGWDELPPHPELEHLAYGDPDMREWKQYVLPDKNMPLRSQCPLRITERAAQMSDRVAGEQGVDGDREQPTARRDTRQPHGDDELRRGVQHQPLATGVGSVLRGIGL